MSFFIFNLVIIALSFNDVVSQTETDPCISLTKCNLQKELQDIRNQIYHESTIRLQFDKELSSMAQRYRTLIVDKTNGCIEKDKTKTVVTNIDQSVQQNTTERLDRLEIVTNNLVGNLQTTTMTQDDSSKRITDSEAAIHELQRNFTDMKNQLVKVSQFLREIHQQFEALNSSVHEAKDNTPKDCSELDANSPDGVYRINPGLKDPVLAYCKISDGKWTVFQRRMNGQTDFYRGWTDYRDGFGKPATEHWLGNKYIHLLTYGRSCSLRIEMTDRNDNVGYAEYKTFHVDSEADGFMLNVGGFSGDKGDGLVAHSGHKFSTKDRDQDTNSGNCAVKRSGAWWYSNCSVSNLNGDYSRSSGLRGVFWLEPSSPLKKTEMMLRCK